MKRVLLACLSSVLFGTVAMAQTKGLIISEILTNPGGGDDSPFEYVELVATTSINFATTPYTVVFTDNGTATSNGWKAGSSVTYAFLINTGSVTAGQVVYVGGTSMLPLSNSGVALRKLNTGSTSGDSFGSAKSEGVLGNGGSNADGVAVFNVTASAISSGVVPVDAIFFGNAVGSAYKSSGSGYQLPVNDKYSGGKLLTNSYLAPDPGSDELVKATGGVFNPATNAFTTARTWATTSSTSYNTTSITLSGTAANIAPTITLATPTVSGTAPATVTLSATAADSDGTITQVEFLNGSTVLATVTTAPYTYSWTNVAAGTYAITARATDNANAVTTSSVQNATVNAPAGNAAPTVTLATPTVSGTAPATVTLSATASDSDGTIAKVEFLNGSTILATVTTSPYTYSWTNVAAGTYTITARATDNANAATTSSSKSVTVSPVAGNVAPTVTLNTPGVSGTAPATITLSATASDSDGTITQVEFLNGSTVLGTDTTSPYSYSWTSVAAGTYTITARATDNAGSTTTSSAKAVTVTAGANVAPTLTFNTTASKYVALSSTTGTVGCVRNNATDPFIVSGLDINVTDENVDALTFTMTSSKTSVVPNANFTITGTGTARKFKITPTGVGFATLTLKVTDAQGLNKSITVKVGVSNALATSSSKDIYMFGVADGSTAVPIDDNYMFAADDETNVIKLYSRNNTGLAINTFDVTSYLNLSGTELDIEGSFRSVTKPNRIYWIGSLSNSKSGEARPDRNRIFATDIVGTGANATLTFVGYYSNLRSKLITWGDNNGYNFTAKAATGIEPKRIDGFNIEGLEMGPDGTTLYIGFRAPYVGSGNNKALICPLTNFETWFGNGSPSASPVFGAPIELSLNNHGIRSLGKNTNNEFLIVAGSYAATGTFELYSWNGLAGTAPVKLTADLTNLKPEGIVTVPASLTGTFTVDLVSDLGSNIPYNDDVENKDVTEPNHRMFLTSTITVNAGSSARIANNNDTETEEIIASAVEKAMVYPNPFTASLTISFGAAKPATAYIYSTTGRLVKELKVSNNEDSYDLSELESGLYFVTYEGMEKAMRIIKK